VLQVTSLSGVLKETGSMSAGATSPALVSSRRPPTDNWCQGVLAWQGEVSKLTGIFHPANSTLTIAQATTSRVNAFGLEFSNAGKNGHSAPFSWAA
jgi:hypothetical protein